MSSVGSNSFRGVASCPTLTPTEVDSPIYPKISQMNLGDLRCRWEKQTLIFEAVACQLENLPMEAYIQKMDERNYKIFLKDPVDFMDEEAYKAANHHNGIASSDEGFVVEVFLSETHALNLQKYAVPEVTFEVYQCSQHNKEWGLRKGGTTYISTNNS